MTPTSAASRPQFHGGLVLGGGGGAEHREHSEDRRESTGGPWMTRHFDLVGEIAALRKGLDAQRAELAAVAEQLPRGIEAAMEALRTRCDELQQQQELQAGALRDGLMEIHQQRAELADIKSLGKAAWGREGEGSAQRVASPRAAQASQGEPKDSVDDAAFRLASESEELRTTVAELHARFEREVTEVLRKTGRQREELLVTLDTERSMREQQFAELRAALVLHKCDDLGAAGPAHGFECLSSGGSTMDESVTLGLAAKFAEAIEAERQARASEGAEVRLCLAKLAAQHQQQREDPLGSAGATAAGEQMDLLREALERASDAKSATEALASELAEVARRGERLHDELLRVAAAVGG